MVKRGLFVLVLIVLFISIIPISFSPNYINACQVLNDAGTIFELNVSISTNAGTCWTANASNILLDCQGFHVNSTGTGATGFTASSLANVTLRGCTIRGFNRAISFTSVNDSEVSNNTLFGGTFGITISSSNYNNISFNSVQNFTDIGVFINSANSNHNILRNNTVHNQTNNAAFLISGARNSTLINNVAFSAPGGFFFSEANDSNITNNIAYNLTGTGFYLANTTVNMSLFNITSFNSTRYGVHINATNDNNISFSNISNNSLGGIYIERGSSGNRIFSNTIYNHTAPGILLELVNAVNRIYSNLFIENNTIGIYLNSSNLTNITDNILTRNTNTGVFLNYSYNNNVTNNTARNNSLFNYVIFLSNDNNLSYNIANNSQIGFNFTRSNNNFINFNNLSYNTNYGFYFTNSTGNNLSLNNATNPSSLAQYFFTRGNATFTGINYALANLSTTTDLNITSDSNVSTKNSDGTFNNFTTDYGTIFFHAATNVSLKLMNRTDSGAAATGCTGFSGTCTLVTVGDNVVNITNTSASAVIDLGLYHDSTAASSSIYVARYSGGWSQVGQTVVSTTTVRYDSITSFSTFAAVSFLATSQTSNVVQEKAKDTGGGSAASSASSETPTAPTPPSTEIPPPELPKEEPKTEEAPKEEVQVPVLETLGDFPLDLGPLPGTINIQVAPEISHDQIDAAREEFKDAQKDEERVVLRTTLTKEEDERGGGGRADVEFKIVKREVSEGVFANIPKVDVRIEGKVDERTLGKLSPKDVGLKGFPSYAILVLPLAMLFLVLAAGKDVKIVVKKKSKKGQIFLIASIIFVLALYSVVIPYNTIKTYPALENFKDLSSNYQTEFPKVYNWALYQGLNVDTSLNNFNKAFLDQAKKTDPKFGAFYAFKDSDGNLKIVNTLNNKVMKITYTNVNAEDVTLTLLSSNTNADGTICVTGSGCGNTNADVGDYDKTFYTTKTPQKIDKLGIEIGDQPMLVDVTKFTGMAYLTSSDQGELPDSPDQVKVSVVQY